MVFEEINRWTEEESPDLILGAGPIIDAPTVALGVEIVRIFPGSRVEGPKVVAALKGPMPWTYIMPTGGVEPKEDNLSEWFRAGVVCVGMESKLISSEVIKNSDYRKLEQDVRNALNIIRKLSLLHPVKE